MDYTPMEMVMSFLLMAAAAVASGAALLGATVMAAFLSAPMVSYFNGVAKSAKDYNSRDRQECIAAGGQWFEGGGGGLFSNPVPSQRLGANTK